MLIKDSWVLDALMENTTDSIYIKDRQFRLCRVSHKMTKSLGLSPAEIYGKTDIELFGEELGNRTKLDDLQVIKTGKPVMGIIEKYMSKGGETNWTSTTKLPLRNDAGEIIGLVGITREINELKGSELEFQWLATHDPLTSLINRYLLLDRIELAIFHSKRRSNLFALLYIDLNGFKQINDNAGHDMGDQYLKKLAGVLTANVRSSDTVARIGGDEFVILLDELKHIKDASIVAKKLADTIHNKVDQETNMITASIGISIFPQNGEDKETLLKAADQAMYAAKKEGLQYKLA